MNSIIPLILIAFGIVFGSCNRDDVEPINRTLITLSGHENGTFELEAEFDYSIVAAPGATSSFRLYIKKNGNPRFELFLDLDERGDEISFQEGIRYEYTGYNDTDILLTGIFILNDESYFTPLEADPATNSLVFTSIEDTKIKGRFEIVVVHRIYQEQKIKVKGTFDALGGIVRRYQ